MWAYIEDLPKYQLWLSLITWQITFIFFFSSSLFYKLSSVKIHHLKNLEQFRDLPHGPMVKTLPSNPGCASLIHGQELRCHMPPGQKKKQNRKQKQYCNKFNKDLKNGPHKKILNM